MSQDLLSSFLDESTTESAPTGRPAPEITSNNAGNPWAEEESSGWQNSSNPHTQLVADDDDDFGDFEDASAPIAANKTEPKTKVSQPWHAHHTDFQSKAPSNREEARSPSVSTTKDETIGRHPFAGHMDLLFDAGDDDYDAGADELGDLSMNPEAAMIYSKRIIAEQEAAAARTRQSESRSHKAIQSAPSSNTNVQRQPIKPTKPNPKDPNVLFDADNVSEYDDDFGGFESGSESERDAMPPRQQTQQPATRSMPAIDLLGLDDDAPSVQSIYVTDRTFGIREAARRSKTDQIRPVQESSHDSEQDTDAWDDFETTIPSATSFTTASGSAQHISQAQTTNSANIRTQKESALPPTNVPPPAVLISLFPSIISEADDALFNAIGKMDLKQRQMLLGHPASHQFLKGYLAHATVMAHIIAGRKLRWKRDQHLTQSMRIGPAAAGGKGGMKLAGLDKAETTKEDREVVDALRLWRDQVGKVRTAVTAASAIPSGPKLPPVPEIAEQMPVKTLKPFEGGITAPHACALCGLKREERVGKVDLEIDDSFGEWWIQGMNMHLSCRDFWSEFEKKLKSR